MKTNLLQSTLFFSLAFSLNTFSQCFTPDYIPKSNGLGTNCSRIYDNNTTIGIGAPAVPLTSFLHIGGGTGSCHPFSTTSQGVLIKFPATSDTYNDRAMLEMHAPDGTNRFLFQTLNWGTHLTSLDDKDLFMQIGIGRVSIGHASPTEQLHTNGGVRFQGLTAGTAVPNIVTVDASGKLWTAPMPVNTPGITNACATINFVPKTTTGGNLSCTRIYDDNTTIGVGAPAVPLTSFLHIGGGTGACHPGSTVSQGVLIKFPSTGNASNDRAMLEMHAPDGTNRFLFQTLNWGTHLTSLDNKDLFMQIGTGRVSIGHASPTEQLHTNGGVRFQGLTVAAQSMVVSIDANGKLFRTAMPTSGITNACATANYMPKTATGGNLTCSQIFDNGTSVGIGATGPFNYTSLSLVGVTTVPATGTVKLFVNGVTKASAYFATSDERFKKQITKIENASDIIKKLEGKSYYWKNEEFKDRGFNSTKQFGFIAQELEKVVPEAVATDENGYKSVNYDMIIPILVQGVKEQSSVIDNLQKQIDELKDLVKSLATTISTDNTKNTNSQAVNLSDKNAIVLDQNVPNPFAESTVINYSIPSDFTKAQIIFTTIDGKIIKAVDINVKGNGTLNVFSNDLTNGLYSYSLIVDGKVIDTKKMIKQ